jgi:hypothetical protein
MIHQRSTTSRLTPGRDIVWIAPKKMNVCLYPSKGSSLIMQTGIEDSLVAQRLSGKEAESSQAVINSYNDQIVICLLDETCAIVVSPLYCLVFGAANVPIEKPEPGKV